MNKQIERAIAEKLAAGEQWAVKFGPMKAVLRRMIDAGDVERVAPHGQKARNKVALTAKGRQRFGLEVAP